MDPCIAVIQPQPNIVNYGVQSIELYNRYPDRASYAAQFGVDPPTYDKTKPTKYWKGLDGAKYVDANGNVTFYTLAQNQTGGAPVLVKNVISLADFATVNLFGVHAYPAYVQPPTSDPSIVPILPEVCFQADAVALAAEWGLTAAAVVDGDIGAPFPTIPSSSQDGRRIWEVLWKGQACNAQHFIAEKNANGVGTPGKWDLTSGPEPNWISSLPSLQSLGQPNPILPVPERDNSAPAGAITGTGVPATFLLPNETIVGGMMGWGIVRSDLQPAPTGGGSADLTPLMNAIAAVAADVKAIAKADRVPGY